MRNNMIVNNYYDINDSNVNYNGIIRNKNIEILRNQIKTKFQFSMKSNKTCKFFLSKQNGFDISNDFYRHIFLK